MSYLQINIGGNLRGLKFNQMAYIVFYDHVDLDQYLATSYYAIAYAGLKANAYVKREEFTDSFETVCEWVDELSAEDKAAMLEAFSSTSQWQALVEKGKEVAEKTPEEKKRKLKSTTTKV